MPRWLALKAEALYLANRISEALAAIKEADALVAKYELRYVGSELHRLRGVCLAAVGADEMQIEASFRAAISIANEQKSVSLAKQAAKPTQNTVAKKRFLWEGTDSDYLFDSSLQLPAASSTLVLEILRRSPPRCPGWNDATAIMAHLYTSLPCQIPRKKLCQKFAK